MPKTGSSNTFRLGFIEKQFLFFTSYSVAPMKRTLQLSYGLRMNVEITTINY